MTGTVEKTVFLSRVGLFSHPLNPNISKLRGKVTILGGPLKEIFFYHCLSSAPSLKLTSSDYTIATPPDHLQVSSPYLLRF